MEADQRGRGVGEELQVQDVCKDLGMLIEAEPKSRELTFT